MKITEPVYQTLIISKLQLHGTSLNPLIKKKSLDCKLLSEYVHLVLDFFLKINTQLETVEFA